jgi:nucleotide-binding universal stress UspA family protein
VELGRQRGVDVQLISIVEPSDFTEYDGSTPADIARATSVAIASREGELTAQRQRVHVTTQEPAHQSICVGSRVEEIVKFAEQHHASLIVMGASSHGALARLLHRHTVMRVAAATEVPILAVRAD